MAPEHHDGDGEGSTAPTDLQDGDQSAVATEADEKVRQSHLAEQAELAEATLADDGLADAELQVSEEAPGEDSDAAAQVRRGWKVLVGLVAAAVLAVAAVLLVNALVGSNHAAGLPETVGNPGAVIAALSDGGIDCSGVVVQGNVATCNATIAVRIFTDGAEAQGWVEKALRDPLTNSSIGWVRSGNAVIASPLDSTPQIAEALGPQAKIF